MMLTPILGLEKLIRTEEMSSLFENCMFFSHPTLKIKRVRTLGQR